MIYFTSDTHFWHTNVIMFCSRPFGSAEVMNEAMIRAWQLRVNPNDTIYHLGDFSFSGTPKTMDILRQLTGKIKFVPGNHDKDLKTLAKYGEILPPLYEFKQDGQKVVLCHFPLMTWNQAARGAWMLHGHCHSSLDARNKGTTRLDVGVDGIAQFAPISFDEVKKIMDMRKYEIVDSHGAKKEE